MSWFTRHWYEALFDLEHRLTGSVDLEHVDSHREEVGSPFRLGPDLHFVADFNRLDRADEAGHLTSVGRSGCGVEAQELDDPETEVLPFVGNAGQQSHAVQALLAHGGHRLRGHSKLREEADQARVALRQVCHLCGVEGGDCHLEALKLDNEVAA